MKVKRLRISFELLREWLAAGDHPRGYSVIEDGLPPDAELINVRHAWPNAIEVLVQSESFPDVPDGQETTELLPVCRTLG